MSDVQPWKRVGSTVKFKAADGSEVAGVVKHAIVRHVLTAKPAYWVVTDSGEREVHHERVIEFGAVRA